MPGRTLQQGVGFPSAERALALRERNTNDPNGLYRAIGVDPGASEGEIKRRCRELLRDYHPDGHYPNRDLFERVHEIYSILCDPVEKARYDHTPEGSFYVDSVVSEALRKHAAKTGAAVSDLVDAPPPDGWSYYTEGDPHEGDLGVATRWYDDLLAAAAEVGYDGRLAVVLSDSGDCYAWGTTVTVSRAKPSKELVAHLISQLKISSQGSCNVIS